MKRKEDRNYFIDFLKFIFSIIIVFFHSSLFTELYRERIFHRGYYAVDFYFIVTGFLFMKSVEKLIAKKSKENTGLLDVKFIWNKIKIFLPNIIFIMIVGYFISYGKEGLDYHLLFKDQIISEFLLLGVIGKGMTINTGLWYISAMLIVLFVLFPIAYKYKKTYNYYIAPLIIFLTLGIVDAAGINIVNVYTRKLIFIDSFYKSIICINLGIISYEISNYIKKMKFTKLQKVPVTILEILIYIASILNMHFEIFENYLTGIVFMIGIAITFSGLSYTSEIFRSRIFEKLGKFGFLLYLNNIPVRAFLLQRYTYPFNKMLTIYWIITIVLSIISYIISEVVMKKMIQKKKKCI